MTKGLKTVELFRYLQSNEYHHKRIEVAFMDERRKMTIAKYKFVGIIKGKIDELFNHVYKLDGRSIRYMRRVKIIENKKNYETINRPFRIRNND